MSAPANQTLLAEVLNITPRQIRKLDLPTIPHPEGKKGRGAGTWYDMAVVVPKYYADKHERETLQSNPMADARLRREELEIQRREFELRQAHGEAMDLDDHLLILGTVVQGVRAKLLALPGTWAPRMIDLETPQEAREAMEAMVEEAIIDLRTLAGDVDGLKLKGVGTV